MDLSNIGLFRLAGSRLEYLAERHRLIAGNVVNANTPAYRAKDLKPFETMLTEVHPVAPERTAAMHLTGTRPVTPARLDRSAHGWETAPDGNTVSLDQEMMKAGETRDAFNLAVGLMQKNVQLLRAAWRTGS